MTHRVHRANLLALSFVMGCVSRETSAPPNMPQGPIAAVREAVPEVAEPEARVERRPFVPCVPLTDCRIVARHPLASAFAQSRGFYASPSGLVASRQPGWEEHGRPDDTFFIEVTESCDTGTGFFILSGDEVLLPFEASCIAEACDEDPAGWVFEFEAIEASHDAHHFVPLGRGFYDDGSHIFERGEVLGDEDVDRTTFHACSTEADDPMSETFYPVAEDSRGLFGYGEHGDVERARL